MQWFGLAFLPMFVSSLSPFIYHGVGMPAYLFLGDGWRSSIIRVVAELLVVPAFGYVGASAVAAFNEIGAFGILIYILSRKGYPLRIADFLFKPAAAGFLMAAILYPARQLGLLLALPVVVAASFVYLGALFLLGTFANEELRLMRDGLSFLNVYLHRFRRYREGEA